jgi:cytosine/adenosine deaminase-related metal-dependent hydrolase
MPHYRAAWLLPVSHPPIQDAWFHLEGGRIVGFGESRGRRVVALSEIDLGRVAVLPGLVNAHTHLELSWMRGRVAPADEFPAWIRSVMAQQRARGGDEAAAVAAGIDEARSFGTALVGDISNTLASPAVLAAKNLAAVVFHELIGFRSSTAERIVAEAEARLASVDRAPMVRCTLAPHAPYSVSPALFRAIHRHVQQSSCRLSSVHLGESRAETQFLRDGDGSFRALLDEVGAWDAGWIPPGSDAASYAAELGVLDEHMLVVHGAQFGSSELRILAASGATLVTCPRGNILTGVGAPPVAAFYESGVRVAVGTDSLASVPDLNVFAELAEMRRLAPSIPARRLIDSATIAGATALGFEGDFGAVEAGRRAALIAVTLDRAVSDVEEYLVGGIDRSQVRWVES